MVEDPNLPDAPVVFVELQDGITLQLPAEYRGKVHGVHQWVAVAGSLSAPTVRIWIEHVTGRSEVRLTTPGNPDGYQLTPLARRPLWWRWLPRRCRRNRPVRQP